MVDINHKQRAARLAAAQKLNAQNKLDAQLSRNRAADDDNSQICAIARQAAQPQAQSNIFVAHTGLGTGPLLKIFINYWTLNVQELPLPLPLLQQSLRNVCKNDIKKSTMRGKTGPNRSYTRPRSCILQCADNADCCCSMLCSMF